MVESWRPTVDDTEPPHTLSCKVTGHGHGHGHGGDVFRRNVDIRGPSSDVRWSERAIYGEIGSHRNHTSHPNMTPSSLSFNRTSFSGVTFSSDGESVCYDDAASRLSVNHSGDSRNVAWSTDTTYYTDSTDAGYEDAASQPSADQSGPSSSATWCNGTTYNVTSEIIQEDGHKREVRREQNRRAARKYRHKQQRRANDTLQEFYTEENLNRSIRYDIEKLVREKLQLERILLQHQVVCTLRRPSATTQNSDCNVTTEQGQGFGVNQGYMCNGDNQLGLEADGYAQTELRNVDTGIGNIGTIYRDMATGYCDGN